MTRTAPRHLTTNPAITAALLTAAITAASCGTASTPATHRQPSLASRCESGLTCQYHALGGSHFGPARFKAGVNAEYMTGSNALNRACYKLPETEVLKLAAKATR